MGSLLMTFDSDDDDEEESQQVGRAAVVVRRARTADDDSADSDEEPPTWSLPAQTHRLYTRLQTFSHRGLRACDDKSALKRVMEGTDCMPESYDLPLEAPAFLQAVSAEDGAVWIWKEAKASKGLGIKLLSTLQDATIAARSPLSAVGQRYLVPFLVNGFKWDLRLYVLLTGLDPVECFLHNEGFARFCGKP